MKTQNTRHLTLEERQAMKALVEQCGFAEVIRTVGGLVGHQIEDMQLADNSRCDLLKIAKRLADADLRSL